MDPPTPLTDDVANNEEPVTALEKEATEAKNENGDGATDTSTQPENSVEGSSSSSGDGEQGSENNNTNAPAAVVPAAAAAPPTAASPTPPQATTTPTKPAVTAPSATKTFVYDPNKITLKFIFANRDGLHVILDCTPADTVGEVKGALLSLWPDDIAECNDGDRVRLICMGKGILMPDSKTLESLEVPVFKTHATPVNVAVRPEIVECSTRSPSKKSAGVSSPSARGGSNIDSPVGAEVSNGCSCVIL